MNKQQYDRLFDRFNFYNDVHYNADVSKIANLANEEKLKSLLEIVYLNGLFYLKEKVEELKDSRTISNLLIIIGPFDKDYSIMRYIKLIQSGDEFILIQQPYGLQNMKNEKFHHENLSYFKKLYPKIKEM